jgi:hypothetical protein
MGFLLLLAQDFLESGAGRGDLAISAITIWNKMSCRMDRRKR